MKEKLVGMVLNITFHSPDSGYTVAKVRPASRLESVTIVGKMGTITEGETLVCVGEWSNNLAYGMQFKVESYETKLPAEVNGIKRYLSSGLVKGIGPVYAKKIVEKFGPATFDVIDNSPNELKKIAGIGKKRIDIILKCWDEQKVVREVMFFLQKYGVSPVYAQKIFKTYGQAAIEKVSENPYHLSRDIYGIGFKKADEIAQNMGIKKDSDVRIQAGIEYVLNELKSSGHTCFPSLELVTECESKLEVEEEKINDALQTLEKEGRVACEKLEEILYVWIKPLYLSEKGIARELMRIRYADQILRTIDCNKAIDWAEKKLYLKLAKNQKEAVTLALEEKLLVITGGPGTGKSTITKMILAITEKLTNKIILAAPTGKAAKRMAEICGKKASTIHSLLEFDFRKGGFRKNRENPLQVDLLVIDEASMIDTLLMYQLLKAVPSNCRLIFVGDIDQLPSVGAGNVLCDIIDSDRIPVSRLTEIFRQAKGSQIITSAHKINKGHLPYLENDKDSDFFFIEENESERIAHTIIGLNQMRLPKRYGFNPISEIQVLCPMKRGPLGTEALNLSIQNALNPSENPLMRLGRRFHEGDKVMQIRNNYKKEVFNGDVGIIQTIDAQESELLVTFDEKEVAYTFSEIDELILAYAVSVHKYQGSECPCIIMPIHTSHYILLHRNLLYTGVTRGKKLVILVGMKKALFLGVKNDEVLERHTGLKWALNKKDIPISPLEEQLPSLA